VLPSVKVTYPGTPDFKGDEIDPTDVELFNCRGWDDQRSRFSL